MGSVVAIAGLSALLGAGIVGIGVVAATRSRTPYDHEAGSQTPAPLPVVIDVRTSTPEFENHRADDVHRASDPRTPPEVDPRREINIPTRGEPPRYQQIGYLSSDEHGDIQRNNIIPLFGRRTYNGSSNWNYYTKTEAGVKIPLSMDGRDCSDDIPGCRELYDDDVVAIPALDGEYSVKLYNIGSPRYIPYV